MLHEVAWQDAAAFRNGGAAFLGVACAKPRERSAKLVKDIDGQVLGEGWVARWRVASDDVVQKLAKCIDV